MTSHVFRIAEQFGFPHGHQYFKCADGPSAGRWAIADGSGILPWDTDDGVLWVDTTQPILLGMRSVGLALVTPAGKQTRTSIAPAEAVVVAVRLGLTLRVSSGVLGSDDTRYTVSRLEVEDGQ